MARPQVFDHAGLARAGLAIAGGAGWAAVSVRSVAEELGVSPMALYRLVPDAEALRRLIADAAGADLLPVDAGPLIPALRAWAVGGYASLCRHPGLASYVIVHWTELPRWLDIVEALLASARADGLTGKKAVATVNAVFAYVLARAQLHDAARSAPRRELGPVRAEPGRYPLLVRNRAEFTTARTDTHFRFGLEALVSGLDVR